MLIHTELFSNVSGLGLEKNFWASASSSFFLTSASALPSWPAGLGKITESLVNLRLRWTDSSLALRYTHLGDQMVELYSSNGLPFSASTLLFVTYCVKLSEQLIGLATVILIMIYFSFTQMTLSCSFNSPLSSCILHIFYSWLKTDKSVPLSA